MAKFIQKLKELYTKSKMSPVEKYLSESEDLVELERRQRSLQRKGIWV